MAQRHSDPSIIFQMLSCSQPYTHFQALPLCAALYAGYDTIKLFGLKTVKDDV